jgi:hypothetical protein
MYYESRIPFFYARFFFWARGEMYHHRVASEVMGASSAERVLLIRILNVLMSAV